MKGDVIGTEMRAFNNLAWTRRRSCTGTPPHQTCPGAAPIGLTGFGPNINIARVKTSMFDADIFAGYSRQDPSNTDLTYIRGMFDTGSEVWADLRATV